MSDLRGAADRNVPAKYYTVLTLFFTKLYIVKCYEWHLTHRPQSKDQASLRISAVSPEPFLLTDMQ